MTQLPEPYRDAVTFAFGDSRELADELLALVLAGRKTATCAALASFGEDGEPMPVIGRRDVVLDGRGRPAVVVETVELTVRRFDEVDAAFAEDEGEGPLDDWRKGHEAYFRRNGGFSPDMKLLCERFRVVEVLKR
ncbi:ASCH domain-containing protein [Ochrobactrum sp. 695/2009]|nr:ASCH domain-containing protein [Brucella intermedia]PJR90814.1 ASCH domain-containing protein [Ochrobactrum sp. 721/2009]PJT15900.1 ASCH domain-containing protein [Ochrobactrum sp. 720/2009]PJT25720.1 ASCH domain-containing protein [Ochrobactrum sp. 715/2009]PJT29326.1 ASCH domain-containing protein [Ochrobactrum sp. 695/2009]PJT35241.1 ASCH domain-containing protein [Ochrobactrum sp. 689/2009]